MLGGDGKVSPPSPQPSGRFVFAETSSATSGEGETLAASVVINGVWLTQPLENAERLVRDVERTIGAHPLLGVRAENPRPVGRDSVEPAFERSEANVVSVFRKLGRRDAR